MEFQELDNSRMQTVMAIAAEGMAWIKIHNGTLEIVRVNPQFNLALGIPLTLQVVNRNPLDFVPNQHRDTIRKMLLSGEAGMMEMKLENGKTVRVIISREEEGLSLKTLMEVIPKSSLSALTLNKFTVSVATVTVLVVALTLFILAGGELGELQQLLALFF